MDSSSNVATYNQIRDSIQRNIDQTKAIITCIMFSAEFIQEDKNTLHHALWAVDEHLENLQKLFNFLDQLNNVS
jgi:uncharacterized membrane protein YgaE (UPF0421/DUF939 family)